MTNQATSEQQLAEISDNLLKSYLSRDDARFDQTLRRLNELRRHFSAPSEPSDELPMVLGRVSEIERLPDDFAIPKLRGCWLVFTKVYADEWAKLYLQSDGTWGRECEKVFESRAAAEAFLRECAAQQVPRPGKVICPSCHGRTIPGDGTWGCDTCQCEGEIDEPDPGHHPETLIADAQRRAEQKPRPTKEADGSPARYCDRCGQRMTMLRPWSHRCENPRCPTNKWQVASEPRCTCRMDGNHGVDATGCQVHSFKARMNHVAASPPSPAPAAPQATEAR